MTVNKHVSLFVALLLLVAIAVGALALSALPPAPATTVPSNSPRGTATTDSAPANTAATRTSVLTDLDLTKQFSASRAMETVACLTDPRQAGRRAGSEASDRSAAWIAGQFQSLGLEPAGDSGTFLQRFSLPYLDLAETPVLEVVGANGEPVLTLRHRQDFREVVSDYAGGGAANGELVFVGAGEAGDYRDLDVAGKVALSTSSQMVAAAGQAGSRGAKAILFVAADSVRMRFRGSYIVPVRATAIPTLLVARPAVEKMLASRSLSLAGLTKPQPLGIGVRASVILQPIVDRPASNVLGVLPGSDPNPRGKVVIIGAHYDHLGTDPDGTIFPGANDDASGVAALLEIARLLKESGVKPGATILFAAWTGEEAGLLGAVQYVRNPAYPLQDTLATIQLDCIAQGEGAGLSISRGRGSVADTLMKAAADLGVRATVDPEAGGSDHVPFYQSGVPAAMVIWSGAVPFIHDPEDALGRLDPAKLRAAGMVAMLTALRLSGRP